MWSPPCNTLITRSHKLKQQKLLSARLLYRKTPTCGHFSRMLPLLCPSMSKPFLFEIAFNTFYHMVVPDEIDLTSHICSQQPSTLPVTPAFAASSHRRSRPRPRAAAWSAQHRSRTPRRGRRGRPRRRRLPGRGRAKTQRVWRSAIDIGHENIC